MSASSHLSTELREMIKSIGETRSKEQEDRIITNELLNLKPKLSQPNITPKKIKEILIRALYIEMLGHNAQIAHIEALKLTQNKNLNLKRMGYLMCSLFFNQDSDLLIMLTSTIQKDLVSTNVNQCVICLTSLPKIINPLIANAVGDSVVKLLTHQTDLIRKKALFVVGRIQQISPGFISDYSQKLKNAVCDREPSVMSASLSLYQQLIKSQPNKFKELAPTFVIILKQIIEHKLPKEFDYHKVPAPWVQIKLLRLIAILGKNDLKASEHCYQIVSQALEKRSSDNNVNVGFALLYQCVLTIATIYPNSGLLEDAAICVSKFLESTSNNLKYMGIRLLSAIFKNYPKILQQHQITVIQCLQSKDDTLRNQTLQLLARMTNSNNIDIIVKEMLESLTKSTDEVFRNNLVNKISDLAERFAPSHEWYIQKMHVLFQFGSEFIKEDVLNSYLRSVEENIKENEDFGTMIVESSLDLLGKVTPTDLIAKAVAWVCGEIGSQVYANNKENLHEITHMLLQLLKIDDQSDATKIWIVDALDKISSCKVFQMHQQVKSVLQQHSLAPSLQLALRAIQSRRLAKYNAALRLADTVVFDPNLHFLQTFVTNQKSQGAQEYDQAQSISMGEQDLGVNFAPYQMDNQGKATSSNVRQSKNEGIMFNGPAKWDIEGYKGNEPKPNPQPAYQKPNYIPIPVYTKPKQEPKQDPNKKKLANDLFGKVGKPGLKGPAFKGPATTKPTPPKSVPSPQPPKTTGNPNKKPDTIDLLDL